MARTRLEPPKVEGFKLRTLFQSHQPIVIPRWQREYTWKAEDEVEVFLTDLIDFYDRTNTIKHKGYYLLGQVILVPNDEDQFEVVDGQQRLTTVFLLLLALLIKYRPLLDAGGKHRTFTEIDSALTDSDGKVWLQSPFQSGTIVLQGIYDQKTSNLNSIGELSRTQKNLISVYEVFEEWIASHLTTKDDIEDFSKLLLENVYFSRLMIEDIPTALDYFEKMNRRGVPLAAADLLKNYLFAQLQNDDVQFNEFTDQWQVLMKHLSTIKRPSLGSPETFIKSIALSKSGTKINGTEPLLIFWKNELKDEDGSGSKLLEFRNSLDKRGNFYARAANGQHPLNTKPQTIGRIRFHDLEPVRFLNGSQHLPVLFAAQHLDAFDYVLDLLNRRFVLYVYARERTGSFESMIPSWCLNLQSLSHDSTREEILAASRQADGFVLPSGYNLLTDFISTLSYAKGSHSKKIRLVLAVVTKYWDIEARAQDAGENLEHYLKTVSKKVTGNDMDHILGQMYLEGKSSEEMMAYNSVGALTLVYSSDHREQTTLKPYEKKNMYEQSRFTFTKSLCSPLPGLAPRVREVIERIHSEVPPNLEEWGVEDIMRRTSFIAKYFVKALDLDEIL